jgi:hypothetical protein
MTTAFQDDAFQDDAFQIDPATDAGYRSFEAFWIGGASATPPVVNAGYRSFDAMWLGGASGYQVAPTPTPTGNHKGGGTIINVHTRIDPTKRKRRREDEEILIL